MFFFDHSILITFIGQSKIRLYHPFYRYNIITSLNFCAIIDYLIKGINNKVILEKVNQGQYFYCDCTDFTLWDCMYDNPDFFNKDNIVDGENISGEDLINRLIEKKIIIRSLNISYDLNKNNPFEKYKGNINEQIATEAIYRKKDINKWWVNQKFDNKSKNVKNTPYRYIQEMFLDNFFENNLLDKNVLEIGCGTGYYTSKMSKWAKITIGFDYDENYIEEATNNNKDENKNLKYFVADIIDGIEPKCYGSINFDYIFLIDVFLFFFDEKFQKRLSDNRQLILGNISSMLSEKGKIIIMDPHLFWLIPQFGSGNYPYGIITEYNKRFFSTIPTLEKLSSTFQNAGLLINKIIEPKISKDYEIIDKKGFKFFDQFPQWIVFELVKKNGT